MNKAYDKVTWQNTPSTASPINATNLNKMSDALDTIDDRVVTIDGQISTIDVELDDKVDKVAGKGLSTEDFTTTEKSKLAGISANAKNVSITPVVTEGTTLANITIDGTTTAIKGSDIDVDDEMSPISTNPVQNKVIYDALNNLLPEETAEGNPISITDASGLSAKSAVVTFTPKQSGTGDPSPDNVRPISGWDSLHLYIDEEQSASPATAYTATFDSTVYGGNYDFVSGGGVNPWCAVKIDLGSLNYTYSSSGQGTFRSSDLETVVLKPASNDDKSGIMCECYTVQTANDVYRGVDGIGITVGGKIWIHDARTTDPDAFKSLVNGLYFIYPLATPTEITLAPEDIELLKGNNTLWTDGDNITLKYSADIEEWVLAQLQTGNRNLTKSSPIAEPQTKETEITEETEEK